MLLNTINEQIKLSKLNVPLLIPLVEDLINLEKASLETSKIFNNESDWLKGEIKIANAEILLSLLRMNLTGR